MQTSGGPEPGALWAVRPARLWLRRFGSEVIETGSELLKR